MEGMLETGDKMETYNNGDLSLLFGPNPLNPFFNHYNLEMVLSMVGSYRENTISLGYIVLALCSFGVVFFSKEYFKEKITLSVLALIGFVLTLGPYLQISTIVYKYVRLPYYYLQNHPLFDMGIVPSRFVLITYFALALLSSFSLFSIVKFLEKRKYVFPAILIVALVILGVCFENYSGKLLIQPLLRNNFIQSISKETDDFTVISLNSGQMDAFLQTQHEKKVVSGFLGRRIHDYYLRKYYGIYPIDEIMTNNTQRLRSGDDPGEVLKIFSTYKIKYILAVKNINSKDKLQTLNNYLVNLGVELVYDDKDISV